MGRNGLRLLLVTVVTIFTFLVPVAPISFLNTCDAEEISDISFRIDNNELYVSTAFIPDQKFIDDLNDGLSKELTIFIDLFRVWNLWPDEFVLGTKIVNRLRSNPIKREYIATSTNGSAVREKRFSDAESMVKWAATLTDVKLTNTRELEVGTYFIKVTAESRARTLPPVIGYFLFFVPDKDFSVSRNSNTFQISPQVQQQ